MTTGSSSREQIRERWRHQHLQGAGAGAARRPLGTGGLLLSVLAATAPLIGGRRVMPTTFAVMGIVGQPLLFVLLGVVLILFSIGTPR